MPNRQQIGFHGMPSARAQTSFASSGSTQRNQSIVSSMRSIAPQLQPRLLADAAGGSRFMTAAASSMPSTSVVVVSASERRSDMLTSIAAGVGGYVPKGLGIRELERALRHAII